MFLLQFKAAGYYSKWLHLNNACNSCQDPILREEYGGDWIDKFYKISWFTTTYELRQRCTKITSNKHTTVNEVEI